MKQLVQGPHRDRLRLWDSQWRLIWDAATTVEPAYKFINTWLNATVDKADGTRWSGRVYRSPNGVERESYDYKYIEKLTTWPVFGLSC